MYVNQDGIIPTVGQIQEYLRQGIQRKDLSSSDQKAFDFCASIFNGMEKSKYSAGIALMKQFQRYQISVIKEGDRFKFIPLSLLAQSKNGLASAEEIEFFRNYMRLFTDNIAKAAVDRSFDDSNDAIIKRCITPYVSDLGKLSKEDQTIVNKCKTIFDLNKSAKANPRQIEGAKSVFRNLIKITVENGQMKVIPYSLIAQAKHGWVSNEDLNHLRQVVHAYAQIPAAALDPAFPILPALPANSLPIANENPSSDPALPPSRQSSPLPQIRQTPGIPDEPKKRSPQPLLPDPVLEVMLPPPPPSRPSSPLPQIRQTPGIPDEPKKRLPQRLLPEPGLGAIIPPAASAAVRGLLHENDRVELIPGFDPDQHASTIKSSVILTELESTRILTE